jgi:hypothetical protein
MMKIYKVFILMSAIILSVSIFSVSAEGQRNGPQGQNDRKPKEEKSLKERYSIEQAISDKAQLMTIAFNGLAFMTGDLGSDSFFPPGKLTDFFGFQYSRDVDEGELGHNMTFLPIIADNVYYILNEEQEQKLYDLAAEQEQIVQSYALGRFPLMKAFRRLQEGDLPSGTTGLDKESVAEYSSELYKIDSELSYRRAQVMGEIIYSLDAHQVAQLDEMAAGSSLTWKVYEEQVDKRSISHEAHVLMMTYGSELFSWYAGDIDSDVYYCPERHGTYFGSFYMKDIPAMGNPDYTIGMEITGDKGAIFLEKLDMDQREKIADLVDLQRENLIKMTDLRREISIELRRFMIGESVDYDVIMEKMALYGKLDGENVYHFATNFVDVYQSLSKEKVDELFILRDLFEYSTDGAFIFSDEVDMPEIMNTDFLFR